MNYKPPFAILILPVLLVFVSVSAQETALEPRLSEILNEVKSIRMGWSIKREDRTARYMADLNDLEIVIQKTGDLDKLLQVSEERSAWELGKETPVIDPRDDSVLLELRKLRYYFDQDIAGLLGKERVELIQQKTRIEEKFAELEKVLTTEGKIPDALLTREMRVQFITETEKVVGEFGGRVSQSVHDPGASGEVPRPASVVEQGGSFPLGDPEGYPPLPMENGRIVFVCYPGANTNYNKFVLNEVEEDDFDDVVALGENLPESSLAAIRANGRPVCWSHDERKFEPRNVTAVKVWTYLGIPLAWVDSEGGAGSLEDRGEIGKRLKELGKIRYLSLTHDFAFVIDRSGHRHLLGDLIDHPNAVRAFQKIDTIVSSEFGGITSIQILEKDGTVTRFGGDGSTKIPGGPGSCKSLLYFNAGLDEKGRLRLFSGEGDQGSPLDQIDERVLKARVFGGMLAAQLESKRWMLFESKAGQWQKSEKLETALAGAIDVHPTSMGVVVAVLPATSVPRSGLWNIDDLIAARL